MNQYRNFIILGAMFTLCFLSALHSSHDGDSELLAFSIDSGKQILAAILTITTVGGMMQRKSDQADKPPEAPKV